MVDELILKMSFRLYPEAEWVSSTQAYECCDSERHPQYYWTPDAVIGVRDYYETFALPFINNMTMFHPYGGELKLGFVPYPVMPGEEIDLATDRECHFSQKYSCIQVELVSFGESQEVSLPDVLARDFPHPTPPTPLSTPLAGGTLIIYTYYVETDWQPFLREEGSVHILIVNCNMTILDVEPYKRQLWRKLNEDLYSVH